MEDDADWKKAKSQPKEQPSLGDLLKHQSEAKKTAVAERGKPDNGLIVDDDFADEFEEEDAEEIEGLLSEKESTPAASSKQQSHDIFESKQEPPKPAKEEDDQEKLILEQFQLIYDKDPQLRQVIGQEASTLTTEEKYQILTAYMQGGGVQGLLEENEEFDADDERMVEEEFKTIYDSDEQLRALLGDAGSLSSLTVKDKYQLIVAYKKGGGIQGLIEEEEAAGEEETSVIEHEGQKYKRVQIEGEKEEYLMDEAGNIYNLNFQYVGQANESDQEEV